MSDELLERFRRSLTAPVTSREEVDALDLEALHALTGASRAEAERLLIERLAQGDDDPRVPDALAYVGATSAIGPLQQRMQTATGVMRARVARALWHLAHDAGAAAVITGGVHSSDEQERITAARSLEDFDGEPFDRALLEACDDEAQMVRFNAVSAIWGKHGLQRWSAALHHRPNLWRIRIASSLPGVRRPGIAELDAALDKLRAGAAPASLGWTESDDGSEAIERFRASFDSDALDLSAFAALSGGDEREFGELSIIIRAERGEARAFVAIEALRTPLLLSALQELAQSPTAPGAGAARQLASRLAPA